MRVISGSFRGKKLLDPKDIETRPLKDLTKESIFNIINHSNKFKIDLENSNILDLFSGIGSFGIECLSRGAKNVLFVENDDEVLTILEKNITHLKIEKKTKIFKTKIISFLTQPRQDAKYEIIFLDPPFSENFFLKDLEEIKKSNVCKKKNLIIIHREAKSKDNLPGFINIIMTKKYGRSKIIFGNLA